MTNALIHDKAVRGRTQTGWLNSYHTFSFGRFNDPKRMGHRALRVINEDVVIPGAGFGEHSHADMDIISYVIAGGLHHEDAMGNSSVIKAGEFQHMYAGTGVTHTEMNASDVEKVHFLQIWLIPEQTGGDPTYFQIAPDLDRRRNSFVPVASPEAQKNQAMLRSDTRVFMACLDAGAAVQHDYATGRAGFLQVVKGIVELDGQRLSAGDGLQFAERSACLINATSEAELMLFDLS
ncbi:MAG: pirin family protein [Pseudomonadota bacterium]